MATKLTGEEFRGTIQEMIDWEKGELLEQYENNMESEDKSDFHWENLYPEYRRRVKSLIIARRLAEVVPPGENVW